MLLRECIESSGKTFREYAREVECSHNHLVQVANFSRSLSMELARKLKAYDPRFSYDDQYDAYVAAQRKDAATSASSFRAQAPP